MNIFARSDSFIGCFEPEQTKNSINILFTLANEIRTKLGDRGYLLDNYVSKVLEAANTTLAYEAAEKGFEAGSLLQKLCFEVMDGNDSQKDHPFYLTVKQSFEEHTYSYQETWLDFARCYHQIIFFLADGIRKDRSPKNGSK